MIASKDSSVIAPSDQLNDGIRNWLLGARAFSILLAIFVVLFSWQTWRSEKGKISDNLKTTAEVESRALERYFQRHERAIQGLREDILDPDGQLLPDEKVHTLLRKAVSREQDWLSVVINTAEGKIVNSSRSLPSAIEAQQRGRYNADLSRAVEELRRDNRLNIGRAVRGRVTNEWVVPLRLGIYDGKGTLTHVIAAALPLTRPISFWEGVPFPNSGGVAINLVREDVYLIGRYPLPQGATAEEVYGAPRTGEFAQRLAQGKLLASGVYQGTAALTGESVLWGYGRLQRYPLAFVIQAPSTLLWNRWWGQVWPVYGMLAFILLCAILIYRVAVNREISNHRESEIAARKLKESETRLELAVRGSRDGIWDWNVVTGENYFSPRWLEILGYAAHELPHTAAVFFDRLHPDDKDAVVDAVKRHFEQGKIYDLEVRLLHKDGSYRWVHTRGEAIRNDNGEVVRMAGSIADIEERRRTQDALNMAIRQKEVLLKEIYHRVKNNLQVVSSLLAMQGRKASLESRVLLDDSANRVQSMALVHEQLYRSQDLSSIGWRDYVLRLVQHLRQSNEDAARRVAIKVDVDDINLGIESAIPLGLIINELISNAFKHGFPGGRHGEILLRMHRLDSGELELDVTDDGVGLPEGFDLAKVTSLGMQLVLSLSEQLNGTFGHGTSSGTQFTLRFIPDDHLRSTHAVAA